MKETALPDPTQRLVHIDQKPDTIWYQWFQHLALWVRRASKPTAWTPTVSASSGTITTKSGTGSFVDIGALRFFDIEIAITTNGTGAGTLRASLPSEPAAGFGASGRNSATGALVAGYGATGTPQVDIVNLDGTYPGANGSAIRISGSYRRV